MKQVRIAFKPGPVLTIDAFAELQGNLKDLSKEDYEKLRGEIEDTGFAFAPHVWINNDKMYLVDGHQRIRTLRQMKKEGWDIPALHTVEVEAKSLKEAKRRVFQGTSQYGKMTGQGLYEFMNDAEIDFDEVDESFRLPDINMEKFKDEFLDEPREEGGEGAAPEPPLIPKTRRGELWFMGGKHRLLCGDAGNPDDIDKLMCAGKADLIFTDPPYNLMSENEMDVLLNAKTPKNLAKLKDTTWDESFDIKAALASIEKVIGENAAVYICTSQHLAGEIWAWMKTWAKYSSFCVWSKTNPMPSLMKRDWTSSAELICYGVRGKNTFNFPDEGHCPNVWTFSKSAANTLHPTQKPIHIPEHAILHCTKELDLVVDLFAGSGSTLMAAERTKRLCFLMEINPAYVDVILTRWATATGQDPTRSDGVKWSTFLQP